MRPGVGVDYMTPARIVWWELVKQARHETKMASSIQNGMEA